MVPIIIMFFLKEKQRTVFGSGSARVTQIKIIWLIICWEASVWATFDHTERVLTAAWTGPTVLGVHKGPFAQPAGSTLNAPLTRPLRLAGKYPASPKHTTSIHLLRGWFAEEEQHKQTLQSGAVGPVSSYRDNQHTVHTERMYTLRVTQITP